jgi:5,5'-dehydrodivanillate O-demethylase
MLTAHENETLTRVGPGTPMGGLLRRYWYPVAALAELEGRWTHRVRLLGEDLVLFKDRTGKFGLIGEFCPHRRASLAYGIPTEDGIRCPYHGWKFDGAGHCPEQPNEPEGSNFKDKIATAGYPVQELGGMLWAYLGPAPAPLLPRFDGYVAEGAIRMIGSTEVACNWLQIMENSVDPVHTEWLHGKLQEFVEEKRGGTYAISRHHLKIAFAEFEFGIYKRRLLEGQSLDADDWTVGHPILFPHTLAVGSAAPDYRMYAFQIRVPMDDTRTMHYWYTAFVPPPGAVVPAQLLEEVPFYHVPCVGADGEYILDMIDAQDVMAWETQGPIALRHLEKLGTTDMGVILLRNVLKRELQKVAEGLDPMGVIRDPSKAGVIELPLEKAKLHYSDGIESLSRRSQRRHSPNIAGLIEVFRSARAAGTALSSA